MMCPAVDNPASCEFSPLIRFLLAKDMNASEICRELCAFYGHKILSE
jgi:hypothetical protein